MSDNFSDKCQCRIIHTDVVERATQGALPDADVLSLVNLFKAIGDSSRMKILYALAKEEMCVCDLAAFLGISEKALEPSAAGDESFSIKGMI
jgi:hypothetical protein